MRTSIHVRTVVLYDFASRHWEPRIVSKGAGLNKKKKKGGGELIIVNSEKHRSAFTSTT